jgi:regulator of replication initiation timing
MTNKGVARAVDLEPIDRLEEKVGLLVSVVTRLRAEQAKAAEEHARLTREIEMLRGRLSDAQNSTSELESLREERETLRDRVAEMLTQLETL